MYSTIQKEETSQPKLLSQVAGVQKKQCQQNSLLIRSKFKHWTTECQLSCSIAETLFGKNKKKQKNEVGLKMFRLFCFLTILLFFLQKVTFQTCFPKQDFFKEISGSQNLKWGNNVGEKKRLLKKLPRTKKSRVDLKLAKNSIKFRPLLN